MKIEIKPGDRQLVFAVLFIATAIVLGAVTAYNPAGVGGTPATMGHSVDEIDWSNPLPQLFVNGGTVGIMGTRTSTDSAGNDLIVNTVYLAQTDGILVIPQAGGPDVRVYVGNTNPPANMLGRHTWSSSTTHGTISVPVPKDEYVRIAGGSVTGTPDIWWQPMGAGGLVRQT